MTTICVFFRHTPQSTNGDFEELMNRNRAVASSAISKAVSGATAGKYSRSDSVKWKKERRP